MTKSSLLSRSLLQFSPHNLKKTPGFRFKMPVFLQLHSYRLCRSNELKIDKKLLVNQHKKDFSFIINNSLCEQTIDRIGRNKKFMIRKSKVPPSCFVNSLLFNENDMANTSLPDLTADLNQVYNIYISKEAMHKKFTPACVEFFKGLLAGLLSGQLSKETTGNALPLHFGRIKIKDSTKFSLPDNYNEDYKGYGTFKLCYQFDNYK